METRSMKRLLVRTLVAAVVVGAIGTAGAQGVRTIRAATQNPAGHPIVLGLERFAELVAAKSGGSLKVSIFPGGTLGSDQANVSALQGGTLQMASMNSGILASQVKEFAIYDFPFMFSSSAEVDKVVDGPFGKGMHERLRDKGVIGLAYFELGFRDITNSRRPIHKVDDLAGLKLRVIPNPINLDWVKALGANPTPLPFPEVYTALEQKAIDGQENPVTVINANKFYEVQKHVVLSHHQYNPQSLLMSRKFWDGLTPEQRKAIAEAAAEATVFQRRKARELDSQALDNMKKNGMQVTELPAAEMKLLREKIRPVTDKHAEQVGKETVLALQAELARIRGQ